MEGPYQLVNAIYGHNGAIRSISVDSTNELIITGCQSDSPCLNRWHYAVDGSIQQIGESIYHDHWVTASAILSPDANRPVLPHGCIITGCMDTKIRVFNFEGENIGLLNGHLKGVISLALTINHQLLSGSWDGTAKLWDLTRMTCLQEFGHHENGVHVLGLNNGTITTVSTGESVNGKPDNYKLRFWDTTTGSNICDPIQDQDGSLRSIRPLRVVEGFITTSNDGSVSLRTIEGNEIIRLHHTCQDDGTPPFVLDSCNLDTENGMDVVSCGEDGSVFVWSVNELIQSIPHPLCVWCVASIPGTNGDFVTGSHDGVLRYFSKDPLKISQPTTMNLTEQFLQEVANMKQKKRSGPSAEELAKAPQWDLRFNHPGKKENDVHVFNKDGSMIAAQWTSGSWVIIGEVTGTGDGGVINGVSYDHVLPVEMETPQGVKTFQLGHNNGENPFVAAQRFIDQNGLGQVHLQEIADWITKQSGKSVPTIGAAPSAAVSAPPVPSVQPTNRTSPLETYKISSYISYGDIPSMVKLLAKIKEFNALYLQTPTSALSESDLTTIQSVVDVLTATSRYHSSEIPTVMLNPIISKMIKLWESEHVFPAYDLIRLTAMHPDGSKSLLKFTTFIDRGVTLLTASSTATTTSSTATPSVPAATVITVLKCFVNLFRFDETRKGLIQSNSFIPKCLDCIDSHKTSSNKTIRSSCVSLLNNITLVITTAPSAASVAVYQSSIPKICEVTKSILHFEKELEEVLLICTAILASLLNSSFGEITKSVCRMLDVGTALEGVGQVTSSPMTNNAIQAIRLQL